MISDRQSQSSTSSFTSYAQKPICVVSHPRSGTHLMIDFIRRHFPQTTDWKLPLQDSRVLILDVGQIWKKETTLEKSLNKLKSIEYPIIKMHGFDYPLLAKNHKDWLAYLEQEAILFYIVRDVRPMMCSYHEYAKSFWEPARVPIKEFIRQNEKHAPLPQTSRIKYWADEVVEWVNKPRVQLIKYEDIIKNSAETISKIASHSGLSPSIKTPHLPPKIHNRWHDYFNRYISIQPTTTSVVIKTKTPKWNEVMDDEDIAFIKAEGAEALKLLDYDI